MANTIKQLASFAVLNVNGGDRVTYTYDEIDAETGDTLNAAKEASSDGGETKEKKKKFWK